MSSGGKKGGKNDKPNQRGGAAAVITDPRFAKMHTNREFMKLPKQQQKKQVDERFKAMLTDKKFKTVAKLDQYGRKRVTKDMDMGEFYRLEEEEEEQKKLQEQQASGSDSESDEQSDEMDVDPEEVAKVKAGDASGESEESDEDDAESDESDDSEDSAEDDSDEESSDSLVDEVEKDRENIPIGDQTKRLAIVNCDWDRIKAQDVYLAFGSFVPSTGLVKSVTVYLSDFGKQQIEEENTKGPRVFRKMSSAESKQSADEDDEDESSDSDSGPLKGVDDEDEDTINERRLRKYEKNKMRYYFGVAEFDSVSSAAAVYKALDGFEIEKTSNRFDLRFVPDDVSFEGRDVRDKCDAPPTEYKPPKYSTKALEHTTAKLTWDETPPERVAIMTGRLSKEQLREMDYQAFLASDSSDADSDDDEAVLAKLKAKKNPDGEKIKQNKRAKYAALLSAIETPAEDANYGDKDEEGEMEITFNTDVDAEKKLQELVQRKKEGKEMTVFDKQMEKERERKQKKKEAAKAKKAQFAKNSASGESEEAPEPAAAKKGDSDGNKDIWADFDKGFEDPTAVEKKKKRKRGKKKGKKDADDEPADEETTRSRRELELLVAGDARDDDSSEEETNKDHERRQRAIVQDDRFSALLTDSRFNPDPTNPLAKRLKGADVIVRERQKRVAERSTDDTSSNNKQAKPSSAGSNRAVADLINVVKKNVTQAKTEIPTPSQSSSKPSNQSKKTKSDAGAPNAKRRKLE